MLLDPIVLAQRLAAAADQHRVVGASLAVGLGEQTVTAATGVLNRRTGQPARTDSLFQIGSITKVWTATLVMQLVDDGLLDLDAPLRTYLPNFAVSDPDVTARVTARHLLTHTSGISGDFFPDNGRGDDCLQRYVAELADVPGSSRLGAVMSYCNAGFTVLGRLVEVVRGGTWDQVLRERLIAPLGLEAAGTLPEEALLWSTAVGHLTVPDRPEPVVAPQWGLSRSAGPAGLVHARAEDLVTFARLHLSGGLAPDGTRLLSETSAAAMRAPQATIPDRWTLGSHMGLGWILQDWNQPVFGHDGATVGQSAFVRVLPQAEASIALLTNSADGQALFHDLCAELGPELAGAQPPARLEPPTVPLQLDVTPFIGTYRRESMTYLVHERDGQLRITAKPSGVLATALGGQDLEGPLVPFAPDAFLTRLPGIAGWMAAVFLELDDGSRFLHLGARATPLVHGGG